MAGHTTAAAITKLTVQRASRDSILLMHDIHLWTVDTAAPTIDTLQKQGYTLVTVSQLLGSTKPGKLVAIMPGSSTATASSEARPMTRCDMAMR